MSATSSTLAESCPGKKMKSQVCIFTLKKRSPEFPLSNHGRSSVAPSTNPNLGQTSPVNLLDQEGDINVKL
jgi:hypothetical protein